MLWDTDLWREMERIRREMDDLYSGYDRRDGNTSYPLINVYDDKENITLTAELPGMTKDKVNITFSEGVLTIAGKQQPVEGAKQKAVVRNERASGEFEKNVRIPAIVQQDKINASFSNGILTVQLPKAEEAKPKTIAIEAK